MATAAARVYAVTLPVLWTLFFAASGVAEEPGAFVPAALGVVAAVWTSRVRLELDADSLLVRNPVRWHRVPYDAIGEVFVERVDLLGNEKLRILGTHRLYLVTASGGRAVLATMWLDAAALAALRARIQAPAPRALDAPG